MRRGSARDDSTRGLSSGAAGRPVLRRRAGYAALVLIPLAIAQVPVAAAAQGSAPARAAAVVQDWPQYLHDSARSGFTTDNAITATNAASLTWRPGWPINVGGNGTILSTQPVVANGVIYEGSWDGNEYALNPNGTVRWKTPLGRTTPSDPNCGGTAGVVSTPAVATVKMLSDSKPSSVLFLGGGGNDTVGGGTAKVEALDAHTGAVRWQVSVGPAPATLMYSSPIVYTPAGATVPSVYIGVASYGDCPLVQGKLLQFDARNGWLQHEFDAVPSGCLGGGVWGSPTVDPTDGSIYIATGNGAACSSSPAYNESVIKLRAWDLSVAGFWQVPVSQSSDDNDFGSAPSLFTGTITAGGARRSLIGIGSKNGLFYVFDRTNLAQGPLAQLRISIGGTSPENGEGTISPAAYDGSRLYIAGGSTSAGSPDKGSLLAFDPNNLAAPLWSDPLPGSVLGAVSAAPGIVVVGQGPTVSVIRASDGQGLRFLTMGSGIFYGAPSISHGVIYEGDTNGYVYAYSVNGA